MFRSRKRAWSVAVFVLVVAASILAVNIGPALGARYRVRATEEDTWSPTVREIVKGDRIVWRNPTDDFHNVKSQGSNWSYFENLPEGETAAKRFRRTGTFKYRCSLHSSIENGVCHGMCGRIKVLRPPQ